MIRVMKFAVQQITLGEETLQNQSSLSHKYYNQLIEMEKGCRSKFRDIRGKAILGMNECEDALALVDEDIEAVYDEIRLNRQEVSKPRPPGKEATPTKVKATPEQQAELVTLKAQQKKLRTEAFVFRKAFKALINPGQATLKEKLEKKPPRIVCELKPALVSDMLEDTQWSDAWKETAVLDAERNKAGKLLRANSEITHGTYAATENAIKTACKTARGDPDFRHWDDGEGMRQVGVQTPGKHSVQTMVDGGIPRIQLLSRSRRRPGSEGNRARAEVWRMRMSLGKGVDPIEFDALIHRPIPEDSVLKWVYLVPRDGKWSVQFTIDVSKPLIERAPGKGNAHIDLRWSLDKDGSLIVGMLNGEETIHVERTIVEGIQFSYHLKSVGDRLFDTARDVLKSRIKKEGVPDWVAEDCKFISKWKSHKKLLAIAERWAPRSNSEWQAWKRKRLAHGEDLMATYEETCTYLASRKIEGEEAFILWLSFWARKERHLIAMSKGRQRRMSRRRKDHFRNVAAKLTMRFATVTFGSLNVKEAARRKTPDRDQDELHKQARNQRQIASPGLFKEIILGAFGNERVLETEKPDTARAS